MLSRHCKNCKKIFHKNKNTSLNNWYGKGKRKKPLFCSILCKNIAFKGISLSKETQFKKGEKPLYSFPKGHKPWNKDKKGIHQSPLTEFKVGQFTNEKHFRWKGESANLKTKHKWVSRNKGVAEQCQNCGIGKDKKIIDWANVDHKYRRELDDYIPLCRKCHRQYDKENNGYQMPTRWK